MQRISDDEQTTIQWTLVTAPLGVEWSGRTRYAAAMHFHMRGELTAEELEVYRICSRLDHEDPLRVLEDRGIGYTWIAKVKSSA